MNIDIHHQAPWKEMSFEISSWYCEGKECFLHKCLGTLLRKLCKCSTVLSDLWSVQVHIDHTVAALGSTQTVTKHWCMTRMIKCEGIVFIFPKAKKSEPMFKAGGLNRSKEALVTQVRVSSVHDEWKQPLLKFLLCDRGVVRHGRETACLLFRSCTELLLI